MGKIIRLSLTSAGDFCERGWRTFRFSSRALLFIVIALVILIVTSSCGGGFKSFHAPFEEESSLVFGYIDMEEAYSDFRWINMKRIKPRTDKPFYGFFVQNGLFYRTYVPEGLYKFDEFGGHSYRLGNMTYAFPQQGKHEMDPVIKVPGIYYLGSYKYKKLKAPLLEVKYSLVRTDSPGEKELLERLLALAVHPSWKEKIERRLKEVR